MANFGLITEGVTDQIIIENILNGYFKSDDIIVNELQPLRDETDSNRSENYGGWTLVFNYCKSNKFKEAFPFNDYIIIQIDTDVSEEKHYDVSKRDENGKELPPEELIEKVIEKFKGLIGEDFFLQNRDKIIFAISVHSIECWLLPLYYTDKKKAKITSCLRTLNQELNKKEKFTIDPENKNPDYYERISKPYLKHKTLMKHCRENPSFEVFIDEIESKDIVIEEDE
ncbi:MAG: phage tail protein [bacterium]|nr:phage tail protein [bacterium]